MRMSFEREMRPSKDMPKPNWIMRKQERLDGHYRIRSPVFFGVSLPVGFWVVVPP
jgi:hypothetical protein